MTSKAMMSAPFLFTSYAAPMLQARQVLRQAVGGPVLPSVLPGSSFVKPARNITRTFKPRDCVPLTEQLSTPALFGMSTSTLRQSTMNYPSPVAVRRTRPGPFSAVL